MDRYNWFFGQYPSENEFDDQEKKIEEAIGNVVKGLVRNKQVVLSKNYTPTASSTPGWNIHLPAFEGYCEVTENIHISETHKYQARCYFEDEQTVNCENDYQDNPVTPSAGNLRYIAVFIKFRRNESYERTDNNLNVINYYQFEGFEFEVHAGAESTTPEKIETPEGNYIKLCDILIDENVGTAGISNPVDPDNPQVNEIDYTALNRSILVTEKELIDYTKYEVIDEDKILGKNKKYLIKAGVNASLPMSANIGDYIDIFSEDGCKIIQTDAEHLISYQNNYFTQKGIGGFLQLLNNNSARLIYKGNGGYKVEPGVRLANPVDLPSGGGRNCVFSYDGKYLAVVFANSPYLIIYKRNGDSFIKLPDPVILPAGECFSCAFSYDGKYLAIAHATTGYLTIYKRNGDVFTKLPDPSILPAGNATGCAFSYDGKYLAVTHNGTPYITVYKRDGDTFTKLPDPDVLPTGTATDCTFSYDGNYLAVTHNISPRITIYKRDGDTFTKIANPDVLPTGNGHDCAFSFDGKLLAVTHNDSPFLTIYKRDGDVFTKLPNPGTLPPDDANDCLFSYDDKYLIVTHVGSPHMTIYIRNEYVFTKISDPDVLPDDYGIGCALTYDNNYLAITFNTYPYFAIYKNFIDALKVWIVEHLDTFYKQDIKYLFK